MSVKHLFSLCLLGGAVALLSGCSSVSSYFDAASEQQVGYYRIYDVKTQVPAETVIALLQETISAEANANYSVSPYYLKNRPNKPGRFHALGLIDERQSKMSPNNPNFAGFIGIHCDRSGWTANAVRNDGTYVQACLYPYKEGYHVDLFARYLKKRGTIAEVTTSVVNYAGRNTDETWAEGLFTKVTDVMKARLQTNVELVDSLPR